MPLGGPELWIILAIVLVLFGGSKVPQLMKGLGEGMKEFKKATKDDDEVHPATPVATQSVVREPAVRESVVRERVSVDKPVETHVEPRL